jgi:CRP/FNR family transcriptional regulator, nitrogen fixation regulation protein
MLASQGPVGLADSFYEDTQPHEAINLLMSMNSLATTRRCRRGERINGHSALDGYWYRVVSGAVRQCVTQPDGHRRIIDLLFPGDIFDPAWNRRRSVLEAAADGTVIALYPRRSVEQLAASDPGVGRDLRRLTLAVGYRLQRQILILGRSTAMERVCSFLLNVADRSPDSHRDRIVLPVSRYDIADYLALSVETVSRCLTSLRVRKAVTLLSSRELSILDRTALEDDDC